MNQRPPPLVSAFAYSRVPVAVVVPVQLFVFVPLVHDHENEPVKLFSSLATVSCPDMKVSVPSSYGILALPVHEKTFPLTVTVSG